MSFAERRLELNERGINLSLLDWGGPSGAPLVLLVHANGACAAAWDPIALELRARHRVVAYDLRGHGNSDKPEPTPEAYAWDAFADDMVAACRSLGGVDLCVAHSFSGSCALMAAERAPGSFSRLVMIDPVLLPHDPEAAERVVQATMKKRPLPSRNLAIPTLRKSALYRRWGEDSLERFIDFGFEVDASGVLNPKCPLASEAAVYRNRIGGDRFVAIAERLELPILLLWAEMRRGADEPPEARRYAEAIATHPRRLLVDIPESGHFAPMEIPPGRSVVLDAVDYFARAPLTS